MNPDSTIQRLSPTISSFGPANGPWDFFAGRSRSGIPPWLAEDVPCVRCTNCGKRRRPRQPRQSPLLYRYNARQVDGGQQRGNYRLPYVAPFQQWAMPDYINYLVHVPQPGPTEFVHPPHASSTSPTNFYSRSEISGPVQDYEGGFGWQYGNEEPLPHRTNMHPRQDPAPLQVMTVINNHYYFNGNAPISIKAAPDYSSVDNSKGNTHLAWGNARMNINHGYSSE